MRTCSRGTAEPYTAGIDRLAVPHLRWWLDPGAKFGKVASEQAAEALAWALGRWGAVCAVTSERAPDYAGASLRVTSGPVDGPARVLAYAEVAGVRLVCDDAEDWGGRIDLRRVLLHEVGHILGIGHIAAGNLMAPVYSDQIADLQPGDVAEAVARYGPAAVAPGAPVPSGGVLVRFAKPAWGVVLFGDGAAGVTVLPVE
jgi:hypothetical protein